MAIYNERAEGRPVLAPPRGADIRARISDNREKRLRIAAAMKAEAGVRRHTINSSREDFSGLAFLGTGNIRSPEGQNIRQLYTVAHECGHIFLHDASPGIYLPDHIREMEAESYAHQAFREHGMELSRRLSGWGRWYVGTWVKKDRAAGIPIDPRVEAYVRGERSPYEPLRMVPATWKLHKPSRGLTPKIPYAIRGGHFRPVQDRDRTTLVALKGIAVRVLRGMLNGAVLGYVGLKGYHGFVSPLPDLFEHPSIYDPAMPTWAIVPVLVVCALLWANLVVLWHTATR